jgi:pimeloyl-ACP methyl ester carboxylesterase
MRPSFRRPLSSCSSLVFTALALALACSHADAHKAAARGACLSMTEVVSRSPSEIDAMTAAFGVEAQLFPSATCGATQYRMTYRTVAPDDSLTVASAGVILPTGCAGPFPLVEYNHGTWTQSNQTLTDPLMHTAQEAMGQFGAFGYAVVMPDYLGYGASTLGFHPYLVAQSNADVTMDAVRGLRGCMAGVKPGLSGQLFLTGTSEGGYVTMATQRAMEALGTDEFKLSAVVATSGPYALADSTQEMLRNNDGVPGYAWMQLQGYQDTYGDVYAQPTDTFQQPYATEPGFQALLPSTQTMGQLTRAGRLPALTEGRNGLLADAFVQRYLANPAEPARVHVEANDLRTFAPVAPLAVCYGAKDPQAMSNGQAAAAYFRTRGVTIATTDIQAIPELQQFIAQMGGQNYHGDIEAPACSAWARQSMFDPLRKAPKP